MNLARICLSEGALTVQLDRDKMSVQRTPKDEMDKAPVESMALTDDLWDQLVRMRATAKASLKVAEGVAAEE